jgi:uncharacterized protein (DUF885 family)
MENNMKKLLLPLLLSLSLTAMAKADDFKSILNDHWQDAKKERVFFRTDPDGFRMNGKLPEFNRKARERRANFNQSILKRLSKIDIKSLSSQDLISFRIFKFERQTEATSYKEIGHYFPITKLFGYHSYFGDAPANMTFLKDADYKKYLISLADFKRYNREHIKILKEATSKGYGHYCRSMKGYEKTISPYIVDDAKSSSLYEPFTKFPKSISAKKQAEYAALGLKIVREEIIPEYKVFYNYFTTDYMKNCRSEAGIYSVKGGDRYYKSQIEYYTTTDLSAKEIHETGLAEIKRIRGEMLDIMKQVGFKGDFKSFLKYLRSEPKFYAKTEMELLGRAALLSKTIEGELPKYFSKLPRNTYNIKAGTRGAYYMPSAGDGLTSGTYFLGTANLKAQPLYTLEALTLHEGVPGHHLQTALAMELDIPEFRRTLSHSAFSEGWALYSERLGKDMGFYKDPYSDFGRLTYETWRACRLVVDTGIHAFGWTRQKAINFMAENTSLTMPEIEAEIDRYITWPAQALSYKIGEIQIRKIRAKAEKTLGAKFSLRKFHDAVIGNGSLPIRVLEDIMNDWIKAQK